MMITRPRAGSGRACIPSANYVRWGIALTASRNVWGRVVEAMDGTRLIVMLSSRPKIMWRNRYGRTKRSCTGCCTAHLSNMSAMRPFVALAPICPQLRWTPAARGATATVLNRRIQEVWVGDAVIESRRHSITSTLWDRLWRVQARGMDAPLDLAEVDRVIAEDRPVLPVGQRLVDVGEADGGAGDRDGVVAVGAQGSVMTAMSCPAPAATS